LKYQGYRFNFELSTQLSANLLVNSDDIKFCLEVRKAKKNVTGFSVLVRNMRRDPALYYAMQKAITLINFINVKCATNVLPIYRGYNAIMKNREKPRSESIHRWMHIRDLNLDLNDKRISSLLNNQEHALLYNYASRGIQSYYNQDPVGMIRDFYQIIEKKNWKQLPSDLKKFKWLRDVLSHKGIRADIAISEVKKSFGTDYFDLTPAGYFDYTSSKNIRHLRKAAKSLMKKALKKLPT